jgi:hypothetical protein
VRRFDRGATMRQATSARGGGKLWWLRGWGVGLLALGILAGGCAASDDEGDAAPPATAADQEEAPEEEASDPCPRDGAEREVSAACIDPWPLTVESGTLRCDADSVTIAADGNVWAVNGMASTRGDGDEIEPIWTENEDGVTRVNIGALIDAGLELCE